MGTSRLDMLDTAPLKKERKRYISLQHQVNYPDTLVGTGRLEDHSLKPKYHSSAKGMAIIHQTIIAYQYLE